MGIMLLHRFLQFFLWRLVASLGAARYLFVPLPLLIAFPVYSQQLSVRHYDVADGLAHSYVQAIYQDRQGYLWFGTREGLSRFDGYDFTNYGVREGLGHIIVNAITEDRQGHLWVGTNGGGVARLLNDPRELATTPAKQKFISFRVSDVRNANNVNALCFDAANNLWISTDVGIYRATLGQENIPQFVPVASQGNDKFSSFAFADQRGRLWFGHGFGLLAVVDERVIEYGVADGLRHANVTDIVEDQQGRLLIGQGREVFEFIEADRAERGRWQLRHRMPKPEQAIGKLLLDAQGVLWCGTVLGLIKLQDNRQTLFTTAQGLSSDVILALTRDREGNLWIGTAFGGVNKLAGERIVNFTDVDGPPQQNFYRVIEDRSGRLYASVQDSHLVEIVADATQRVLGSGHSPRFTPQPVQDGSGVWWMSTTTGLYRLAQPELQFARGRRVSAADGIASDKLAIAPMVAADQMGRVWLWYAHDQFIYRRDPQSGARFERLSLNAALPDIAFTMLPDRAGALWLAGNEFLARWQNGQTLFLQPSAGLPETRPRSFFQDSRGWLWIGLRYGGVSLTKDPQAASPQFVNYSTATGLASDTVWTIAEDDAGRMYFGTGKGLNQLDLTTGRIRHFTSQDGLAGDLINHCFKDRQGYVWVATTRGLSRFDPRAERSVVPPPPIYLSRVQAAGEDLPLAETGAARLSEIALPSARNNLLIEFVAPNFLGEHRLRYQYKLEGSSGVDEDWSQPSERRAVNYARLAPGAYRFLARALDENGATSAPPAVFEFRILPPLWQRGWFLTLVALTVGLAGYALYRYRVAQLLKLERMRTRIAADLHDDIGANLTRISILSEVARQQANNGATPFSNSLQSIADIARESVASMSDIVWAINPQRDSLLDLTRRLRQHAEEVLTPNDIALQFTAPVVPDIKLDVNVRRDLYLIFKEAVNNAARHAACAHVSIELRVEQAQLTLLIRDDGRGFDTTAASEGNGLLSMQRRAKALGGVFSLDSHASAGTRLELTIPLPQTWFRG